jgi:hypothetical protein
LQESRNQSLGQHTRQLHTLLFYCGQPTQTMYFLPEISRNGFAGHWQRTPGYALEKCFEPWVYVPMPPPVPNRPGDGRFSGEISVVLY